MKTVSGDICTFHFPSCIIQVSNVVQPLTYPDDSIKKSANWILFIFFYFIDLSSFFIHYFR